MKFSLKTEILNGHHIKSVTVVIYEVHEGHSSGFTADDYYSVSIFVDQIMIKGKELIIGYTVIFIGTVLELAAYSFIRRNSEIPL